MCESLPFGNFKMYDNNLDKIVTQLHNWKSNSKKGYIIEVDLEYPKELHDLHNSYPLAPEKIKVDKISKLIPTLYDKKKLYLSYKKFTIIYRFRS